MTMRERMVLLAIPFSREGGVRRKTLAVRLGIPDRSLRDIIESLQNAGWPIVNFQDGEGYFLAETAEEVVHYKNQERKRARNTAAKAKCIKFWPDIRGKVEDIRAEQ